MKFLTTDRELVCLLIALNGSKPEGTHSKRRQKDKAFDQFQLDRIEELARPTGPLATTPPTQWPTAPVELEPESLVCDYLVEKFGAEGEVAGGAFVERTICRFTDRLKTAIDAVRNSDEKK